MFVYFRKPFPQLRPPSTSTSLRPLWRQFPSQNRFPLPPPFPSHSPQRLRNSRPLFRLPRPSACLPSRCATSRNLFLSPHRSACRLNQRHFPPNSRKWLLPPSAWSLSSATRWLQLLCKMDFLILDR